MALLSWTMMLLFLQELSVTLGSITDLVNPRLKNFRSYSFNLMKLHTHAVIEVEFVTTTNFMERDNTILLCGSMNILCDKNLRSYEKCLRIGSYNNSTLKYRYNCTTPLTTVQIYLDGRKEKSLVRNVEYIDGKVFPLEYHNKIKDIISKHEKRYNNITVTQIPGVPYRGYFFMFGPDAIALAVQANKPVVVQSKIGEGRVFLLAHEKYHTILMKSVWKTTFASGIVLDVNKTSINNISSLCSNGNCILKWYLHDNFPPNNIQDILSLVKSGSTLIAWITPWYYEEYVGHFQDASWLPVLGEAGIWPVESGIIWNSSPMVWGGQAARSTYSLRIQAELSKYSLKHLIMGNGLFELSSHLPWKLIQNETFISQTFRDEITAVLKKWHPYVSHIIPCYHHRIRRPDERKVLLAYNNLLLCPVVRQFKAPGYFAYPGAVDQNSSSNSTVAQRINFPEEVVPTGLYLAPGESSSITVLKGNASDCRIIVGWSSFDVSTAKEYLKWPKVTTYTSYDIDQQIIASPFGGLVWLNCNSVKTIQYSISNVYQAVLYDIRSPALIRGWKSRTRGNSVPWGILAGDSVVFIMPSVSLKSIEDPSKILTLLDKGIKAELYLVGETTARRREIVSVDYQIKMGVMHSGYPIGALMRYANPRSTYFMLNHDRVKKEGCFGLFHEIGHNLIDPAIIFPGSEEVINNILTVRAEQVTSNFDLFYPSWFNEAKVREFLIYPDMSLWPAQPKEALTLFIQLVDHFGWELWRRFFLEFKEMSFEQKRRIQNKEEMLIIRLSKIADVNLIPFFDFWGFPITDKAKLHLKYLPNFFPNDKITQLSYRAQYILSKYSDMNTTVSKLSAVRKNLVKQNMAMAPKAFLDIT